MQMMPFQPQACQGYHTIFQRGIGGFLYLGFLPDGDRLLCISSQYLSLINLLTGEVREIDGDYDEESLLAYGEGMAQTIDIVGQTSGALPLTNQAEVTVSASIDRTGPYPICSIFWQKAEQPPYLIFESYLPYVYGFSPDGRYYVHADDGGLTVLRKKEESSG
ncbi:hypothetical protein ACVR05_05265 [Streptococcus caprae]|uniref:Uncharacterized protein n=1 Tax=Streptococcus caprae TaxID=1640501 RepID=A0ABV8CT69_9STRE